MAARYRARRTRASPLWQCLHACLDDFLAAYPFHYANALGLWEGLIALPPPHAPPAKLIRAALWAVDAGDGRCVEFEPGFNPLPTDRLHKAPRERHLTSTPEDDTTTFVEQDEPRKGREPEVRQREDGLFLVYDEPPPPDDGPVFWTE